MVANAKIDRNNTVAVNVGGVIIGGCSPVVVQSMTNTDTADIDSTVKQVIALAEAGSENYIALVITMALMVGVLHLLLGVFRLGFMVNFLSHPVISGFTSAAAIVIGLSQLKHLLGINMPKGEHLHEILYGAFVIHRYLNHGLILLGELRHCNDDGGGCRCYCLSSYRRVCRWRSDGCYRRRC